MTSPIAFIPQGIFLVVTLDKKIFETTLAFPSDNAKKGWKDEQVKKHIDAGKETIVVVAGDGCNFVKTGDKVLIANHVRLQQIELEEDENVYFVIREADILGKLD